MNVGYPFVDGPYGLLSWGCRCGEQLAACAAWASICWENGYPVGLRESEQGLMEERDERKNKRLNVERLPAHQPVSQQAHSAPFVFGIVCME